jgi:prevent-host-death family protein
MSRCVLDYDRVVQLSLVAGQRSSYICGMPSVSVRDLRNDTDDILDRVEAGEDIEVWRGNHPVARIVPLARRRTWIPAAELIHDLADLGPDTTGLADELRGPL